MPGQYAYESRLFAELAPPTRPRYPQLVSAGLHLCAIAMLVLVAPVIREAPEPVRPPQHIYLTELAPPPPPPALHLRAAPRKVTLPAPRAKVRPPRRFEAPHFAAPRVEQALRAPQPPPLPAEQRPRIELPEAATAIPHPNRPPGQPVQLGSFTQPVVKTSRLAPVPAASGAFAGAAKLASKPSLGAAESAGFGEAAAAAGQTSSNRVVAAGFGAATAGHGGNSGGSGPTGPGGFGDAVARSETAELRPAAESGGFQGARAVEARPPASADRQAQSPVAILDKPRPAYTEEARRLKIEGDVVVEVLFPASGRARVLRVVRGLGHGLDESAVQAAEAIRFRPATRGGIPVDTVAQAHIVFELAY
ncbi:MAG TPA: energy transducer TonB [Bryobacteraceae bacterium]|nr:energy transducer TonB [Bryobacteraceae bacterium]